MVPDAIKGLCLAMVRQISASIEASALMHAFDVASGIASKRALPDLFGPSGRKRRPDLVSKVHGKDASTESSWLHATAYNEQVKQDVPPQQLMRLGLHWDAGTFGGEDVINFVGATLRAPFIGFTPAVMDQYYIIPNCFAPSSSAKVC